jgi:hypothetical protein
LVLYYTKRKREGYSEAAGNDAKKRKGGVQRSGDNGIRFADSDDLSEAKGSLRIYIYKTR